MSEGAVNEARAVRDSLVGRMVEVETVDGIYRRGTLTRVLEATVALQGDPGPGGEQRLVRELYPTAAELNDDPESRIEWHRIKKIRLLPGGA